MALKGGALFQFGCANRVLQTGQIQSNIKYPNPKKLQLRKLNDQNENSPTKIEEPSSQHHDRYLRSAVWNFYQKKVFTQKIRRIQQQQSLSLSHCCRLFGISRQAIFQSEKRALKRARQLTQNKPLVLKCVKKCQGSELESFTIYSRLNLKQQATKQVEMHFSITSNLNQCL